MRGSPLLRAAIVFLVILALGYPLWRMTRSSEAEMPSAPKAAPAVPQELHLQLAFTLPPKSLRVLSLGKEIWQESAAPEEIEKDLKLLYPPEGIDLQFQVDWPDDAPLAAMRVKLTDPAGDEHEKTVWSKGPADEVLTFP